MRHAPGLTAMSPSWTTMPPARANGLRHGVENGHEKNFDFSSK
jgi:hypothetical protein